MSIDVGDRLRRLRQTKSYSQRELAGRCGVTNGAISMMEQNRTSPSVASLKKILDAMGVTMAEFFSQDDSESAKIFFTADELVDLNPQSHHGQCAASKRPVSLRHIGSPGESALMILHESYPPGADTGADMICHEAEEGGLVISGEIEITVGERTGVLGPGDGYLFDSRLPHRFRNLGAEECVIISACTPPSF